MASTLIWCSKKTKFTATSPGNVTWLIDRKSNVTHTNSSVFVKKMTTIAQFARVSRRVNANMMLSKKVHNAQIKCYMCWLSCTCEKEKDDNISTVVRVSRRVHANTLQKKYTMHKSNVTRVDSVVFVKNTSTSAEFARVSRRVHADTMLSKKYTMHRSNVTLVNSVVFVKDMTTWAQLHESLGASTLIWCSKKYIYEQITLNEEAGRAHEIYLKPHSTHCNILQHTTTHCNTLQHTATHCNSTWDLPQISRANPSFWGRSNALLQCVAVCCSVLQCVAVCCSVLQCGLR